MKNRRLLILSGDIGAGKTTICRRVAEIARKKGFSACGIVSPGVYEKGRKTGIRVTDLKSGESRSLAVLRGERRTNLETGRWAFFSENVEWADQVLKNALPCALLVVDELGPLEFEYGKGWRAGVRALDQGDYKAAIVVIRPRLINDALARWPDACVRKVRPECRKQNSAEALFRHLFDAL